MKNASFEGAFLNEDLEADVCHEAKLWSLRRRPLCPSEIVGVLLSVASIWAVTAALVLSAAQRLIDGDYDVDGQIMLITSACAVGVNAL